MLAFATLEAPVVGCANAFSVPIVRANIEPDQSHWRTFRPRKTAAAQSVSASRNVELMHELKAAIDKSPHREGGNLSRLTGSH